MNNSPISPTAEAFLRDIGELPPIDQEDTFSSFEQPVGDIDNVLEESPFYLQQVRDLAKEDLNFLAGLLMPTIFKFFFPPILIGAWMLLTREVVKIRTFSQIALGIPRGHAKTTLMKIYVVWCILFTNKKFILVIARTATLAENIIADIADMLSEPNVIEAFGDWREKEETNRANLKKFYFQGRPVILAGLGAGGSIRGLNIKNARPDLIIFEDIQDRDDADNKEVSQKLLTWMTGTAMKAKAPDGCLFLFIGNMFPTDYSILKKLKDNPTWIKFISGAILENGDALWEELRPKAELIAELENDMALGLPEVFFSEVMNDTESSINANIDTSLIQGWKWNEADVPQGKMIIIDPARGNLQVEGTMLVNTDKKDKVLDPITVGYCEVYDGMPALRELQEGDFSPKKTIAIALTMALRHGCKLIVCESNHYQSTLLFWFNDVMTGLGITGIFLIPMHSTNIAKNSRILSMIRGLQAGEQAIHPDVRSAVTHQLINWKPLKRNNNDGILDLLTMAPRVVTEFGGLMLSEEEIVIQEGSGVETIEGAVCF